MMAYVLGYTSLFTFVGQYDTFKKNNGDDDKRESHSDKFTMTPKGQEMDCRAIYETLRQKNRLYDPALKLTEKWHKCCFSFFVKILLRHYMMKMGVVLPNIIVVTNNPDVAEKYASVSNYRECNVLSIFEEVRDAIHKGVQIISHPLSGSIKPNQTPYKSVVISAKGGTLDFKSLQIIEDAIATLKRLPENTRSFDESILADFRIIDLDHIMSAVLSIK